MSNRLIIDLFLGVKIGKNRKFCARCCDMHKKIVYLRYAQKHKAMTPEVVLQIFLIIENVMLL